MGLMTGEQEYRGSGYVERYKAADRQFEHWNKGPAWSGRIHCLFSRMSLEALKNKALIVR
jgi:hypothetical protein